MSEPASAITPDLVRNIARLSRLTLDESQLPRLTAQLESILHYVAKVGEAEVAGVEPLAHALPLQNVLRDDVAGPSLDRDEVLSQAPAAEDGRFRVPRILGEAP